MFEPLSTSIFLTSHLEVSMPMPMLKTMSWCLSQHISALLSETELFNVNDNDKAKQLSILLCFNSVFS